MTDTKRHELDRAIAEAQGAAGILTRWQASSPLSAQAAPQIIEQFAAPSDAGGPIDWRALFATGSEAHAVLTPKDAAKDTLWLAYTDVHVPQPAGIELLASSRGSLQVWLNGKLLYRRDQPRNFQIDSDRFAGDLVKGANRLLVQTGPADGRVEFHLRFRRKSAKAEHERLTQAALSRTGNPERGKSLFFNTEKSQCLKCHQLGNQGERIGPELTGIGSRFSRIHIIESILEPSRTIAPSFGTVAVTLKNGKTLTGVKVMESERMLTLADNQGQKHLLAKADIEEQQISSVSTMPDALEQRYTENEFVDLLAFLDSQKENRKP